MPRSPLHHSVTAMERPSKLRSDSKSPHSAQRRRFASAWFCCAPAGRTPFPTMTKHSNRVTANAGIFHKRRGGTGSGTTFLDARQASISLGKAYTLARLLCECRWTGSPSSFSQRRAVRRSFCRYTPISFQDSNRRSSPMPPPECPE